MRYRYCPLCRSELHTERTDDGQPYRQKCPKCRYVHYNNPKSCVGALIIRNGKLLMIQRAHEPYKHHWDFPGGFLISGELPKTGLKREVAEELGIRIKIIRRLGEYTDTYGPHGVPTLNMYFLCRRLGGRLRLETAEIADARWFNLEEFPPQLAFTHTARLIRDFKELQILV